MNAYLQFDLHHVNVVWLALDVTGRSHLYELSVLLHFWYRLGAAIAETRAQSACQLPDDLNYAPFVGYHRLHAFRHIVVQVVRVDDLRTFFAIFPAKRRVERRHAPVHLELFAVLHKRLAGTFVGSAKEASNHNRRRAGRQGLCDVTRVADAAV